MNILNFDSNNKNVFVILENVQEISISDDMIKIEYVSGALESRTLLKENNQQRWNDIVEQIKELL